MTETNGHHEWPVLMEGAPGERSDDRAENVHLLDTDYGVEGEESKRTAELIKNKNGNYWWIANWVRQTVGTSGSSYWASDSGFSIDTELLEKLSKLGATP